MNQGSYSKKKLREIFDARLEQLYEASSKTKREGIKKLLMARRNEIRELALALNIRLDDPRLT